MSSMGIQASWDRLAPTLLFDFSGCEQQKKQISLSTVKKDVSLCEGSDINRKIETNAFNLK
jgi:hypothetical protein